MNNDICRQGKKVGIAEVAREGLYYTFRCLCHLDEAHQQRIRVKCAGRITDLGLCVPMNGGFGITTKIPIKKVGEGQLVFELHDSEKVNSDRFVPVHPDKPFQYLCDLHKAYLSQRNGELWILIKEGIIENPTPSQPDNDQIP